MLQPFSPLAPHREKQPAHTHRLKSGDLLVCTAFGRIPLLKGHGFPARKNPILYQGKTLVVPQPLQKGSGFSPCGLFEGARLPAVL